MQEHVREEKTEVEPDSLQHWPQKDAKAAFAFAVSFFSGFSSPFFFPFNQNNASIQANV